MVEDPWKGQASRGVWAFRLEDFLRRCCSSLWWAVRAAASRSARRRCTLQRRSETARRCAEQASLTILRSLFAEVCLSLARTPTPSARSSDAAAASLFLSSPRCSRTSRLILRSRRRRSFNAATDRVLSPRVCAMASSLSKACCAVRLCRSKTFSIMSNTF